jgi:ribosomal protein S18 acetylase RimI-like enzyme
VAQLARATPGVIGLRLYVERDNAVAQRTYAALGMRDAGYRVYEQPLD